MPRKARKGLCVKQCELVVQLTRGKAIISAVESGWFIHACRSDKWYALMDLRFVRDKDALRAAQSLTAAGLDSHAALMRADPMTVKEIATRYLQW